MEEPSGGAGRLGMSSSLVLCYVAVRRVRAMLQLPARMGCFSGRKFCSNPRLVPRARAGRKHVSSGGATLTA